MAQSFTVDLFHGLLHGDRQHGRARLRELNGHDETMFADLAVATPAEQVSRLIEALVLRVGEMEDPPRDIGRKLTVGDRERLVLAVCGKVLGPQVDLVVSCPSPSCAAFVEIPVRFADVMVHPDAAPHWERWVDLDSEGARWRAHCRPPVGADQERAARRGDNAARGLIVDCVLELTDPAGRIVDANALPGECEAALADALLAFDSAAETRVVVDCPSCGGGIDAVLDSYLILKTGLGGARGIYDEVYRMARAYHWSEAEILSLPMQRRRRYLAIAQGPEAGA